MKMLFKLEELENYKSRDLLPFECDCCSTTFYRKKHDILYWVKNGKIDEKRFCSRECSAKANKKIRTTCECTNCKKSFERLANQIQSEAVFCSRSCAAIHNNKVYPKRKPTRVHADLVKNLLSTETSINEIAAELSINRATVSKIIKENDFVVIRRPNKNSTLETSYCKVHPDTTFSFDKSRNSYMCSKCATARVSKRRKKLKLLAVEYKGGKCECCGYDKFIGALEFHHREPEQKEFSIAKSGHTRSWDKLKLEVDKCDLLCANNCHREKHGDV